MIMVPLVSVTLLCARTPYRMEWLDHSSLQALALTWDSLYHVVVDHVPSTVARRKNAKAC